jgi:hypothetical protein
VKTETDWGSGRGGCPVALLVFLGVVCGLVMVGYCGATAATYPALLLALPRRVLAGWSLRAAPTTTSGRHVCRLRKGPVMTDIEIEELLTPAEVAALFRVDPKTVTRWHSRAAWMRRVSGCAAPWVAPAGSWRRTSERYLAEQAGGR